MRERNKKYINKHDTMDVRITVIHFLGSTTRIIKIVINTEVRRNPNLGMRKAMIQRLPTR